MKAIFDTLLSKVTRISMWHRIIAYFLSLMVLAYVILGYYRIEVVFSKYATEKLMGKSNAFNILHKHEEDKIVRQAENIVQIINAQTDINPEHLVKYKEPENNEYFFYITEKTNGVLENSIVISDALSGKKAHGREIWNNKQLEKIGFPLDKFKIKIKEGDNAFPLSKSFEDNALVYVVAHPILKNNQVNGVVVALKVFNHEAKIMSVAQNQLQVPIVMTLGDTIITSEVPFVDNEATGVKLPREVVLEVIDQKKPYYGKTKMFKQTVYVAFLPLFDNNNNILGTIGVILPIDYFKPLLSYLTWRFNLLIALCVVLGVIGIFWFAREINRPLRALLAAANEMASAKYPEPIPENVGLAGSEMTKLVNTFNSMIKALKSRDDQTLRVSQDMEEKNMELVAQQEELQAQQEELLALNQEMAAIIEELDSTQSIIYTLALAVEAKDQYTKGHSERVAKYAELMAKEIKLPEKEVLNIKDASLLHDIGKIGVNDIILHKPAALSADEFALVQEHPLMGEKICAPLRSCANILPLIRHHHEWYNGNGYPDGLKGDEIPLGARIMAVADAYDAMTTDRPYRKGMSMERAMTNLKSGSGQQWDSQVVDVFIKILSRESNDELSTS